MPIITSPVDIWEDFSTLFDPPWISAHNQGFGRTGPGSFSITELLDYPSPQSAVRFTPDPNTGHAIDASNGLQIGFAFKFSLGFGRFPPSGTFFSVQLGGLVDPLGVIYERPTGPGVTYFSLTVLDDSRIALVSNGAGNPPYFVGNKPYLGPPSTIAVMLNTWYWIELIIVIEFAQISADIWKLKSGGRFELMGVPNNWLNSFADNGNWRKDIGPGAGVWPGAWVDAFSFQGNNANTSFTDFYVAIRRASSTQYAPYYGDSKKITCSHPSDSICIGDPLDANINVSQVALEYLKQPRSNMRDSQSVLEWLKLPKPAGNLRVSQNVIELIKSLGNGGGNRGGTGWKVNES